MSHAPHDDVLTLPRVIVAQIGARMHYAVPTAFERRGVLAHFYTDLVASPTSRAVLGSLPSALRPSALERFLGRFPDQVPRSKISCTPRFAAEFQRRRRRAADAAQLAEVFRWSGKSFCHSVLKSGFRAMAANSDTLYTFSWGGLELLRVAHEMGLATICEQYIAPFVEAQLLSEEHQRFPGWEAQPETTETDDYLRARVIREWETSDTILCPSEFVRAAVIDGGGDPAKCRVVPYAVDAPPQVPVRVGRNEGKLRVLTVGAVGLRKGAPYVLEAAKRMAGEAEFRMVGAVHLTDLGKRALQTHVELTGPIPRSQMAAQFAWADVFLLPSLCEGSATATYEAMSVGLPVVCTANTGSVIRDGVEGRIIPIRDPDAIVAAIHELSDQACRSNLAENAMRRSADYTVDRYGDRLLEEVQRLQAKEVVQ